MKTDSAVVPLTKAQRNYALKTGSGFINLYTLMGGDGSMAKWVQEEPVMANKDYTHFNYKGSKKIAALLYEQISSGYNQYKALREKSKDKTGKVGLNETDTILNTEDSNE
jgi:hypothetical protein